MKALITVGGSEGTRRCDSRCYDASSIDCDCVCQGINHGVGLKAAQDNTERMADALRKEYERRGEEVSIPSPQERLLS